MNAINVIRPYRALGMWVFDDAAVGLVQEPFVGGADTIIDIWVQKLRKPEVGFRLMFSEGEFPGYQYSLVWRRAEMSGNYYYCEQVDAEGWLCPALFKYFEKAPAKLFVSVSNIEP